MLDRNRPKHVGGGVVADESLERIAQSSACLERGVHYLLPPDLVLMSFRPLVPVGSADL